MHDGKTCAEYRRELELELNEERKRFQVQQNAASEQVVNTTSKACPKCSSRLDKYTGCDHVTCKSCLSLRSHTLANTTQVVSAGMSSVGCASHVIADTLASSR